MMWFMVIVLMMIGLFLSGFFSGSETGLYCVNRLRLELGVKKMDVRAQRLVHILEDEAGALSVTLIGTNVMNYLTTTAAAFLFAELVGLGETDTELYTVVVLTPIVFVFGEVVPKNLFQLYADQLLPRWSWLLALANWICRMTGCVWLLKKLTTLVQRIIGIDETSDPVVTPKWRIAALLQEALADQSWGQHQSTLIDRVCQLSETPLHVAMVPKNRVTVISAQSDNRELVRIVRRTGHARLPVFDQHRTRVIGLIKVDDLLQSRDWEQVGERVSPITAMQPHVTVANAISRMQSTRINMAVVTDHGGRMLGIITLNDLLKEIVGDMDVPL